jgi:hypothetical protein
MGHQCWRSNSLVVVTVGGRRVVSNRHHNNQPIREWCMRAATTGRGGARGGGRKRASRVRAAYSSLPVVAPPSARSAAVVNAAAAAAAAASSVTRRSPVRTPRSNNVLSSNGMLPTPPTTRTKVQPVKATNASLSVAMTSSASQQSTSVASSKNGVGQSSPVEPLSPSTSVSPVRHTNANGNGNNTSNSNLLDSPPSSISRGHSLLSAAPLSPSMGPSSTTSSHAHLPSLNVNNSNGSNGNGNNGDNRASSTSYFSYPHDDGRPHSERSHLRRKYDLSRSNPTLDRRLPQPKVPLPLSKLTHSPNTRSQTNISRSVVSESKHDTPPSTNRRPGGLIVRRVDGAKTSAARHKEHHHGADLDIPQTNGDGTQSLSMKRGTRTRLAARQMHAHASTTNLHDGKDASGGGGNHSRVHSFDLNSNSPSQSHLGAPLLLREPSQPRPAGASSTATSHLSPHPPPASSADLPFRRFSPLASPPFAQTPIYPTLPPSPPSSSALPLPVSTPRDTRHLVVRSAPISLHSMVVGSMLFGSDGDQVAQPFTLRRPPSELLGLTSSNDSKRNDDYGKDDDDSDDDETKTEDDDPKSPPARQRPNQSPSSPETKVGDRQNQSNNGNKGSRVAIWTPIRSQGTTREPASGIHAPLSPPTDSKTNSNDTTGNGSQSDRVHSNKWRRTTRTRAGTTQISSPATEKRRLRSLKEGGDLLLPSMIVSDAFAPLPLLASPVAPLPPSSSSSVPRRSIDRFRVVDRSMTGHGSSYSSNTSPRPSQGNVLFSMPLIGMRDLRYPSRGNDSADGLGGATGGGASAPTTSRGGRRRVLSMAGGHVTVHANNPSIDSRMSVSSVPVMVPLSAGNGTSRHHYYRGQLTTVGVSPQRLSRHRGQVTAAAREAAQFAVDSTVELTPHAYMQKTAKEKKARRALASRWVKRLLQIEADKRDRNYEKLMASARRAASSGGHHNHDTQPAHHTPMTAEEVEELVRLAAPFPLPPSSSSSSQPSPVGTKPSTSNGPNNNNSANNANMSTSNGSSYNDAAWRARQKEAANEYKKKKAAENEAAQAAKEAAEAEKRRAAQAAGRALHESQAAKLAALDEQRRAERAATKQAVFTWHNTALCYAKDNIANDHISVYIGGRSSPTNSGFSSSTTRRVI